MAFSLLLVVILAARAISAPACNDNVTLTVSVTATNLLIPENLNLSSLSVLDAPFFNNLVSTLPTGVINGTWSVSGRYCEPEVYNASRQDTIQLLVHGVGYTRDYWSGGGLPGSGQQSQGANFSWVDFASADGYPTFSIDRICNGQSDHPPGVVCQLPLNAAVLHQVIQQLRQGIVDGRPFSKVIWVGHSLGSLIANVHARSFPTDIDSYVLTGFSNRIVDGLLGILIAYRPLPAALVLPSKFGSLGPDYLTSSSRTGFEAVFYYDAYTQTTVNLDYAARGTLALGELSTALLGQLPAPEYRGSVLVLTGQHDQVFCGKLQVGVLLGVPADCGSGGTSAGAAAQILYPAASNYQWVLQPRTGHILNFQETAPDTFKVAHEFLAAGGF